MCEVAMQRQGGTAAATFKSTKPYYDGKKVKEEITFDIHY